MSHSCDVQFLTKLDNNTTCNTTYTPYYQYNVKSQRQFVTFKTQIIVS